MKEQLKNILKKMIPNELIQYMRMGKDIIYYSGLIKKIEMDPERYDYLLGTPIHTNLGDHLITLSERYFLNNISYTKEIIEIPIEVFQVYKLRLSQAIPVNSTIFINGGGWMGNLWPKEELIIQEMVKTFINNKIIIFPQTIFYDSNKALYEELIISGKQIFENCTKLLLCVRDQQSYDFAKKHYNNIKIVLVPDMALIYFDEMINIRSLERKPIVKFCLRSDRELCRDELFDKKIRELIIKQGYQIGEIDTMAKRRVSGDEREKIVKQRLREFSSCQMVVTDRLHGMIFSYLAGTPCIVMDNKTKKVFGVYNTWLKNCKDILPLYDGIELSEVISFINRRQVNELAGVSYNSYFERLKEDIIDDQD
ncbi:polysaccharide pyruvyl transferase family protein [Lacrimispora sp.]|uniref:polysaccharide pyruvyl transferase family protein n=1 Tax=Lacrimispora sp. TaxID=2719234 RepID=UPI002FDA6273